MFRVKLQGDPKILSQYHKLSADSAIRSAFGIRVRHTKFRSFKTPFVATEPPPAKAIDPNPSNVRI